MKTVYRLFRKAPSPRSESFYGEIFSDQKVAESIGPKGYWTVVPFQMFDTAVEYESARMAMEKKRALNKLTSKEKKILGL